MPSPFDQFVTRARELISSAPDAGDLERNLRALASATLQKMDVVSREEFDAQSAVLARTRAKLDALEKQLESLQQSLSEEQR